jgi:hypothetical protein
VFLKNFFGDSEREGVAVAKKEEEVGIIDLLALET